MTCSGCNALRRRKAKSVHRLFSTSVQIVRNTGYPRWMLQQSSCRGRGPSRRARHQPAPGCACLGRDYWRWSPDSQSSPPHGSGHRSRCRSSQRIRFFQARELQPEGAQRKRCRSSRESFTWRRMLFSNPGPTVSPAWIGTTSDGCLSPGWFQTPTAEARQAVACR